MKRTFKSEDNMRGGPGGPGGPGQNKRFRQDPYNDALAEGKFELRVLVPSKAAGAVIGKGGEYIKSLREKYDATLTVPDRSTPERVLTMVVDQARVIQCFTDCLGKLAEEQKKPGELEVRILVHQSHAGAIIGRGGQKIKELREQTSSQIKVFQECCPNSTDRVVLITTEQSKVPFVVQTLIDFMRDIPIKGMQKPYDPTNYDPRLVFNYGGFQSDKPFNGGMPGGMGGRGPPPPQMPPNPYGDAYGRGPPMGGGYGGPPPYGGPRPGGPPPMGAPPLGGPGFGGPGLEGPVTTTQVTIPNELGGTIIGKGGERINRIRAESGARIDVGNAFGNEERIITISGSPHQIQTAQYLLQQSVRASEAGRRYLREQR
ncbi:Protein F26B1.2 c [Aphelenchoides avenae]|nr:Protein F26B1.2 c [Aphelenchus avenae]